MSAVRSSGLRLPLLGLLGGLVLFGWGFVSHVVLSLHDPAFRAFTDEAEVAEALEAGADGPGVYYLPYDEAEISTRSTRAFVALQPAGTGSDMGQLFALGVLIKVLSAMLVIGLIRRIQVASHAGRVGAFALVGFLIGFTTQAYYWNWFGFSAAYGATMVVDGTIGWALVGAAVTKLLSPPIVD